MLLYTHVVTALKVQSLLSIKISDPGSYLLGAILPDARYFAGIPRNRTHLEINKFLHLARKNHINSRDLLIGYIVHLTADELNEIYTRKLLFPILSKRIGKIIKPGALSVIMEIYYLTEQISVPLLSDNAGRLGEALNLRSDYVSELVTTTNEYIQNPSVSQAIKSIVGSHIEANENIQFEIKLGKFIHSTKPLRNAIIKKVQNTHEKLEYILANRCASRIARLRNAN